MRIKANLLMKKEIRKIKTWIKYKKISQLWMYLCAISDVVSYEDKLSHSELLREALYKATEVELDKTISILTNKIQVIKDTRTTPLKIVLDYTLDLLDSDDSEDSNKTLQKLVIDPNKSLLNPHAKPTIVDSKSGDYSKCYSD